VQYIDSSVVMINDVALVDNIKESERGGIISAHP
jgi:hypothetical protein